MFENKYIILHKLEKLNTDISKSEIGTEEIQGYCSYELEVGKSITLYSDVHKNLRSYHCTSAIVKIDLEKNIIQTKNSIFKYFISN